MSVTRRIRRTIKRNRDRGLIQQAGFRGRMKRSAQRFLQAQRLRQRRAERAAAGAEPGDSATEPTRALPVVNIKNMSAAAT